MSEKIQEFFEKHKICSEFLFVEWEEFIELLYSEGGRVDSILWFEHIEISQHNNSLGSGGYKDKNNPNYMYAETHIFKNEMENLSLHEINNYIESIIASYPNNKLIPSFFIVI